MILSTVWYLLLRNCINIIIINIIIIKKSFIFFSIYYEINNWGLIERLNENKHYLITHSGNYRNIPISSKSCHGFKSESTSWTDKSDHIVPEVHVGRQTWCCGSAARWITINYYIFFLFLQIDSIYNIFLSLF